MIQVWLYDENNIYTESKFVDKVGLNMTKVSPLSDGDVGTIPHRPRFDEENHIWVEDMTDEEIKALEESNKIDICPEKTTEEKVEDLINQVTVMDEIIASLTLEVL